MPSNSLEGHIVRYKVIYSATALILGLVVVMGGYWLGSLDGSYVPSSHIQVTGWTLHIFGCAILYNGNNMWPSLWLILVSFLTILITQYGIRTNREIKSQDKLDSPALRSKFVYSVAGLFIGLFITIYAITFMESGINLCPADLVPDFPDRGIYMLMGPIIFLVGIIVIVATRYRIRIHKGPETKEQSKQ